MLNAPDHNDPVAYLPWWCKHCLLVMPRNLVVVIPDPAKRVIPLKFAASKLRGRFAQCPANMTPTGFYSFLAQTFRLRCRTQTTYELSRTIRGYLDEKATPVFLDRAERLSPDALRRLYCLYHDTQGAFVVSSPDRSLLERICRLRDSGRFLGSCAYYWLDISLPSKLIGHLQRLHEIAHWIPPSYPRVQRDDAES